ncbi:hypothetical protein DRV84_00645 [Rhodosalinus sediminis]|uniref:Transferrin-binding protein B C-lobe/N-lobe beta barrel domain-containing protein n=1 Tax=Rhodosalinus sediminis TaxID=1940533 RepID=A0A3D9BZ08_9RHOB|nr:hypothetical protein [Rhodosalinus sediminis]REC58773.1 hypothetical protein DRV84_00645 [Rhodosalinus sediminis]
MTRSLSLLSVLALVAACSSSEDGSNPFDPPPPDDGGETSDDGQPPPPLGGGALPPGTANPTPDASITRYEERTDRGDGFAEAPSYDAATDTFVVDNLPFDGDNTYTRDAAVASLGPPGAQGPFAVYENADTVPDPETGTPIDQLAHKVLFQRSPSGRTELVIIRAADYEPFGFGGWAYQRNGGVELPETLQATFSGDYAALRDFDGRAGLEYATGAVRLDVDWEDFNGTSVQDAIKGTITDRRIYDLSGADVTQDWLDALGEEAGRPIIDLPAVQIVIRPSTVDQNGEIAATVRSAYTDDAGEPQQYETGTLNAILAGPTPDEIVGIVEIESDDLISGDGTVRETGGFVANR